MNQWDSPHSARPPSLVLMALARLIANVRRADAAWCWAALLVAVLTGTAWGGGDACCHCGPGCVDLWVINTRGVPCCGDLSAALDRLAIFHCEPGGWVRYTRQQFLTATDSSLPVCFYVHGIFSDERLALKQAGELFGKVGAGLPPFRGVLWKWPSEFECGVSVRDQVERSNAATQSQAFYMASLIADLGPRVPVSLVGHSLGCRTVVATLQGLASREIAGQPLAEPASAARRPIQAVLVAPAIEPFSLWPGGQYDSALSQVERMLITYNPGDRVLRTYEHFFDRRPLGLRGLPQPAVAAGSFEKVRQFNANPAVGKRHVPSVYFDSPAVAVRMRGYVGRARGSGFRVQNPEP